jgi:DNA repair exonuclease SbcCD nuclease subunit
MDWTGPLVIYPGSTERTSFAEKDEPKGFFEVVAGPDEPGGWSARRTNFHELPTRQMVDLEIDPGVDVLGLRLYLEERIAPLDPNSVVRLNCAPDVDVAVLSRLTAPFLRSVFPASMNVQHNAAFGRRFRDGFRGRREGVG